MPRAQKASLPRWARISRPPVVEEMETLDLKQEEQYLRTRMHQSLVKDIDDSLKYTLELLVSPLVAEIAEFFRMVSPSENGVERPAKRPRDGDPLLNLFEMEPPQQYPATLLPLAVLHGPPSLLDRQEVMCYLVHKIRDETKNEMLRPCVCWLQSSESSSIRHSGPFLQEILRQCLAQESDPRQFRHLLSHKTLSFSKALLTWAQHTTCFGSIIICIDNVECIPDPLFQDFLQLLASLRAEKGLPLQVVLLTPPGRIRQMRLDSATQGMYGILVRDFFLPKWKDMNDCVWNRLLAEQPLPIILLHPSVLRSIHEHLENHHVSVVRMMMMLKQALAHTCTQRGCVLLGQGDSSFMKDEKDRINFFCLYSQARKVMCPNAPNATVSSLQEFVEDISCNQAALAAILRALHRIGRDISILFSTMEWVEGGFSVSLFNRVRDHLHDRFCDSVTSEIIGLLLDLRGELQGASEGAVAGAVPPVLHDLLSQLNELIVLTDNADGKDDIQNELSQMFEQWVYDACTVAAALQNRRGDADSSPLSFETSTSTVVDALAPQCRRQITDALLHPPSTLDHISLLPSLVFSPMRDRVLISREECFAAFAKQCSDDKPLQEQWIEFAFGIHQLFYCGLLGEKRGSKNDFIYERTALVWCSGD